TCPEYCTLVPDPGNTSNDSGSPGMIPCSFEYRTIACPMGCSEYFSEIDARRKILSTDTSDSGITSVTDNIPFVSVPVLSNAIMFIFLVISRFSPPLMSIPFSAALPPPTISADGVAIPSAHGHAMTITDTNARSEKVSPIPPKKNHPSADAIAIETTTGTKYEETLSANLCIGTLLDLASSTSLII